MTDSIFKITSQDGKSVAVGGMEIIPRSQSIRLKCPFIKGGIQWNRPQSIIVRSTDNELQMLPVVDKTRLVQLGIFLCGAISILLVWRFNND